MGQSIQLDLGIENVFLRELPGLCFWILGIVAQLYLVRVFSIPRPVARLVLLCQVLIYLVNMEAFSWFMRSRGSLLGSFAMLWWWSITPIAFAIWLSRRLAPKPFSPERRSVLRTSIGVLGAAPAVALGFGIITRKDLAVQEVSLKFANLPKDLQGLRIVQLSDIHMSSFYTAADLRRAVDAANGLRADLIFVTGDLITDRFDPIDQCILELKRLRATNGLWGCLGNHEMHAKIEKYATENGNAVGLRFLRHEQEMLRFGSARLNLVGVDHQKRNVPYLRNADQLVVPDAFNLLLSHNPDVFPVAEKQGYQLTVSGHTHGGQINLELLGKNYNVADVVTPFTKGTYHINSSSLYVNSGLGTIGVPVRLGSPSEVTLITLCNS
jgi:predicted MPP superfamily phosphohydrolase